MKKALIVIGVFGLLVGTLVYVLERPTQGVEPVIWDQDTCAHCHMHLGDPHYAAQLQTADGRVLNFDDPGCLFEYVEQNQPQRTATYFHHYREERWLSGEHAGFIDVDEDTPMGYGLGAVDQREYNGARSFETASRAVISSEPRVDEQRPPASPPRRQELDAADTATEPQLDQEESR